MSADTFGIVLVVASVIGYFATRKGSPKFAQLCIFAAGIGVGMLVMGVVFLVQLSAF